MAGVEGEQLLFLLLLLLSQGLARTPWLPVSLMLRSRLEVLVSPGAMMMLSGEVSALLILECARGSGWLLLRVAIACFADVSRFGTSSV